MYEASGVDRPVVDTAAGTVQAAASTVALGD